MTQHLNALAQIVTYYNIHTDHEPSHMKFFEMIIYFCQAFGIDLGYAFTLYLSYPSSPAVRDDYKELKDWMSDRDIQITISEEGRGTLDTLKRFWTLGEEHDVAPLPWLVLCAQVHHAYEHGLRRDAIIARFDNEEYVGHILYAMHRLVQYGLVPSSIFLEEDN